MFLALALTSLLALAPQDPAVQTSREAYVEGWFQETAEANLEAALRSYRLCVELGDAPDRELIARAWWRMGMIARARGEEEVAAETFDRVLAEYADTRAADRVRESLAEPSMQENVELHAMAQALKHLEDMLLEPDQADLTRFRTVFQNLSPEQIAKQCRSRQGSLDALLAELAASAELADDVNALAALVPVADPQTAQGVIEALRQWELAPLAQPLADLAHHPAPDQLEELDEWLFIYLIERPEPNARQALQVMLERRPALAELWTRWGFPGLDNLLSSRHQSAVPVLEKVLAATPHTVGNLERLMGWEQTPYGSRKDRRLKRLFRQTPGGEMLRGLFAELPTDRRHLFAEDLMGKEPARDVIDMLLADREPQVRGCGLQALLLSENPNWGPEALERLPQESADTQRPVLHTACRKSNPAITLDEILEVADSSLREYVYATALVCSTNSELARQGRGCLDVLRIGLDREDPELLRAAFLGVEGYQSLLDMLKAALQVDLPGGPETSLAERMIVAAFNSPEEAIRVLVPQFAREILPPEVLRRCLDPALRDPSPRVRHLALANSGEDIAVPVLVSLLTDPSHEIFYRALSTSGANPVPLLAALEKLTDDRQLEVLNVASYRALDSVVKAIYERAHAPESRRLARLAFEHLKTRDPEVLIEALVHRDEMIQAEAIVQLDSIESPTWNVIVNRDPAVRSAAGSGSRLQALDSLREHVDDVTRALRLWNIEQLTANLHGQASDRIVNGLARELAALGDESQLRSYALNNQGKWSDVGGRGLVLLEARDAMREVLDRSTRPDDLIPFAVELGLTDACLDLARSGRSPTDEVVQELRSIGRYADIAHLLLAEGAPRCDQPPNQPREVTFIVDAAVKMGDPKYLSRAAELLGSAAAVNALFEANEFELILTDLPRWQGTAIATAMEEIGRRIEEPAVWPVYVSDQADAIAIWREKLGVGVGEED